MADGQVVIDTSLDSSGFMSGIEKLGSLAGKGLKATATAITAVSTALAGCAAYSIKVGSAFEAGMSNVEAISGASSQKVTTATGEIVDGLSALTAKAKEMGATTKFSAKESSDALGYMAMAGWDAQQMYDGLAGIMTLAAASGEDLALTSDIVTDALTAFGMKASDSTHFADILAKASASANTNVALMGETFKYVAPLCGTMGYSAEDAAIAIGLMANSGIKGSQAGTTLKTAIANMAAPTKAMATQMAALGIEITNSDGSSKSLMEVLVNLRSSFDGLSEAEQATAASTIFGKESMSGMLAVINSSDEEFAALTEKIYNCDGAAAEMAATMQDNLQGQLVILQSSIEGLGIAVYEKMQEPLKELAIKGQEYINQLTKAFEEGGFKGLAGEIGTVLADAVSEIVAQAPKMVDAAVSVIQSFISGIQTTGPEITAAAVEVGESLLTGIFAIAPQLVEVGVELLTSLITGVAEATPNLITAFVEMVATIVTTLIEQAPALAQAGLDMIQALVDGVLQALPLMIETAPALIQSLCDNITMQLPQLLEAAAGIVGQLASAIVEFAPQLLTAAVTIVKSLAQFIITNLPAIVSAGIQVITKLAETLIANIPSMANAVIQVMQGILQFVVENLPTIAEAAVEIVTQLCESIVSLIPSLIPVVSELIMNFFDFVVQNLPTIVQAAIQVMNTLVQGIIAQIPTLIPAVIQIISQIFNTIVSNLPTIVTGAIQIINTLAMGLIQAIPQLIAAIPQIVTAIIDGILNTDWISVGVNIISGIASGIANAAGGLVRTAVSAARDAINAVKGWLGIASPSKRAKKEIGRWILPGVGEGVEETEPILNDQMEDSAKNMVSSFNDGAKDIDVSGLVEKMRAGVDTEMGKIATNVTVRTKTGSGQVDGTASEGIDYGALAWAIVDALTRAGLKVECDERELGRLIAELIPT